MLPREVYLPGDREGFKDSAPSRVTLLISGDGERGENVPLIIKNAIGHKQCPQERPDVMIGPVLWSTARNQTQHFVIIKKN